MSFRPSFRLTSLAAGLLLLVGATIVIGYGNRLGAPGAAS